MSTARVRWPYLIAAAVLIVVGLPARLTDWYPLFVVLYLGDALWAMMIYLLVALTFSRLAPWKVLALTVISCWLVEFSQLYQAEWINTVRRWPGMGLLLGYGFLWTDLVAYTLGPLAGFALDLLFIKTFAKRALAQRDASLPEVARG
jgi:hypothetical protein